MHLGDLHSGPSTDIEEVKGFEEAFKDLGRYIFRLLILTFAILTRSTCRLVFKVGCELATACQPFGTSSFHTPITLLGIEPCLASSYLSDSSLSLSNLIGTSQTVKARLLHYFPPSPDAPLPSENEPIDSWCGFHLDHSLLTGLCSVN